MATGGVSNKELETALEKQADVVSGIAGVAAPGGQRGAASISGLTTQQMQMPVLPPAMFPNPQQYAIHSDHDKEMNPNEGWVVQP